MCSERSKQECRRTEVVLELKVCAMDMHGREHASDLLLEMVRYTQALQLIHNPKPTRQLISLFLQQQLPHSLLQARQLE